MKILFWIGWLFDILIFFLFLSTLLKTYTSGVMASKSKEEIFQFVFIVTGLLAVVAASIILYHRYWLKTAALIASLPFLVLFGILLLPLLAWLSGARMN